MSAKSWNTKWDLDWEQVGAKQTLHSFTSSVAKTLYYTIKINSIIMFYDLETEKVMWFSHLTTRLFGFYWFKCLPILSVFVVRCQTWRVATRLLYWTPWEELLNHPKSWLFRTQNTTHSPLRRCSDWPRWVAAKVRNRGSIVEELHLKHDAFCLSVSLHNTHLLSRIHQWPVEPVHRRSRCPRCLMLKGFFKLGC